MNIEILTANLGRIGGEQRVAIEEVKGLKNRGYNVRGYSFLGSKNFWIFKGAPFMIYPNLKLPLLRQSFNCWISWYIPSKINGDILICHGDATFPLAFRLKKQSNKIKYVPYFHTLYGFAHPLSLFQPLRQFSFRNYEKNMIRKYIGNADHIITNSTFMTDLLLDAHPNLKVEITVIHPGVTKPKNNNLLRQKKEFGLTLTRIHKGKRLEFLLEVIKEIPDIKWIIAGAITPHMKYIQQKILDLRLEKRVRIISSVTETQLEQLYNNASIFVHANEETFGMPALEALVHGCPIIHPSPSGVWDIAQDGKHGYKVERDNLEDFINKITKLLENPRRRARMGENGKALINKVSWDVHLDALEKLVNSVSSNAS